MARKWLGRWFIAFAFLGLGATGSTTGHAALSGVGEGEVSFTALGPAGMRIVGTGGGLQVSEIGAELVVVVPLRNLDTKIELRNRHMRERYLEVDKYPVAELRVPKAALAIPGDAPSSSEVEGTMTLHGQSRRLSVRYTATPKGQSIAVSGTVRLNMTDFGIERPGYSGVSVRPDVDVRVSFDVQNR